MIKLFDDKNNTIIENDDLYPIAIIISFLEENGFVCMEFDYLSELIETMTGDSSTAFNTIGEMLKEIPDIVCCGEECSFLQVIDLDNDSDGIKWFILGWNNEDNIELCNKIIQTYFPGYVIIEDNN